MQQIRTRLLEESKKTLSNQQDYVMKQFDKKLDKDHDLRILGQFELLIEELYISL